MRYIADATPIGKLAPGEWANLRIPGDEAPERWWIAVNGPVYACPVGGP